MAGKDDVDFLLYGEAAGRGISKVAVNGGKLGINGLEIPVVRAASIAVAEAASSACASQKQKAK